VITPRAFFRDLFAIIEEAHAIRTGLHAILAADAVVVIDQDHTIVGSVGGTGRTHLHAGRMRAVVAELGHEECLFDLCVLVDVGESIFPFRTRGFDVHRIVVAIDARFIFTFQIDIPLHPGAEMMRILGDVVFRLARLDATQAADALCGIDAERPAMLGPVVTGYRGGRRCRLHGRGFGLGQ
jgi:hypothetical protein